MAGLSDSCKQAHSNVDALTTIAGMIRPSKKLALIVVDMQNHFIDIIEFSLMQKLRDITAFMRERGVPVVYTYHGHPDPANEEDTDVCVAFWGGDNSLKCVPSLHHHLLFITGQRGTGVKRVGVSPVAQSFRPAWPLPSCRPPETTTSASGGKSHG